MEASDHIITIGQQARLIENVTSSGKAKRLAAKAVQHATGALQFHNEGKFDGANLHAETAAELLRQAALLHVKNGQEKGEISGPALLDVAHLGAAQESHQGYVDSVNEGKNNGR